MSDVFSKAWDITKNEGPRYEPIDHHAQMLKHLSMAITHAMEAGHDDLEAEIADIHTRAERMNDEQYDQGFYDTLRNLGYPSSFDARLN